MGFVGQILSAVLSSGVDSMKSSTLLQAPERCRHTLAAEKIYFRCPGARYCNDRVNRGWFYCTVRFDLSSARGTQTLSVV